MSKLSDNIIAKYQLCDVLYFYDACVRAPNLLSISFMQASFFSKVFIFRRSGALAGGSRRPLTNYNVGQRGNGQRVQRSSRGQQQPRRPISPIRSSDRRKIAPLQQQQHPTSFSIPSPGRGGDDQQHSTNEPKKIETRESDQPPTKKFSYYCVPMTLLLIIYV